MADENHLKNAGRSITRGLKNAGKALSEGRLIDATESAWEGGATATRESAKGAMDSASEVAERMQDDN